MLKVLVNVGLALIFSYVSMGIINLKKVKTAQGYVEKAIAAFPKDKKKCVYSLFMLVYMIMLALMLGLYYKSENLCDNAKILAVASLMWPMAQIDYKYLRIPNKLIILGLSYRAIILLFELLFYRKGLLPIVGSELIGCFGIAIVLAIVSLIIKNGIGMGDVKLFMLMGLMLGAYRFATVFFLIMIFVFFGAIYKLVFQHKNKDYEFAFGPYIAVGTCLALCIFN